MLPRLARANRATHDRGKLRRGSDAPCVPSRNNRSCNPFSKPFFPISLDHLPDLVFFRAREPLGCALAARGIHAHVERSFLREAEAALRLVELRAGNPEVQQHPGHPRDSALGERRAHRRESPVDQLKTRIFDLAMRKRRGVLIKSEKSSANTEMGEDGRAVPAAAKGAIDVGSVFPDSQGGNAFFE